MCHLPNYVTRHVFSRKPLKNAVFSTGNLILNDSKQIEAQHVINPTLAEKFVDTCPKQMQPYLRYCEILFYSL